MNETKSKKVIRVTRILALILSVSAAFILPLGYFALSYQQETAVIATEAEANAFFITQLINANPQYWRYSQHRLEEALNRFTSKEHKEARRVVLNSSEVIASNPVVVEAPVIKRTHPLFDSGVVVAWIEIERSLKPVITKTALFGFLGIALGLLGYIIFNKFPMRVLTETLKSLFESEEKFRAITSTAVDGIIVMDNHGCITYWNPASEKIFGYSEQEAVGRQLHQFLAPLKYHDSYHKGLNGFSKTGEGPVIGKTIEIMGLKKDGTEFPVEISTSTMKIKGEWHAVGLVHDITARKKAEMQLYNSQQMLWLVLDNIPQRVFWKDKNSVYMGCNKPLAIDAGLPEPALIIGRTDADLSWKESAAKFIEIDKDVIENKESKTNYEEILIKPDGSRRWINKNKSPLYDKDGNVMGLLGTYDDITDRKEAEKELTELYEMVKSEAEISRSLLQLIDALNTGLDEKELVKNMVALAPKYLKFDRMGLFRYDKEIKGFKFSGAYGFAPDEEALLSVRTFNADELKAVRMIMNGETVIIDNGWGERLLSKELVDMFSIHNAVIVPVSFRGKVTGALYADYSAGRLINQRDLTLLKGLAHWMGIATQNSKLYKESNDRLVELKHKVETIQAMAQLDREILSTIDRNEILKTATVLTSTLLPCDRVAILLRNGSTYWAVTEWGVGNFTETKYDISKSHFSIIEESLGPISIPDISEDKVDCTYHKDQSAVGIKSSFIVPLINKGKVMGVLDIGSLDHGKLTSTHLSTAEKIAAQITVALENARLYEDLEQLLVNTITSLAHTIDAKSPWTKGHSERVTKFAVMIAKELGLKDKDLHHIKLCGMLHDIGKIGTYDVLLDKPGKLTPEEFELVKKHPEKGAEIIAPIKQLESVIPGILYHHERYDGKGYPFGIKGDDIPLCASILTVADSFDSMTADRPYRQSPGLEYAISELKSCSGKQFNPRIVDAFLQVLQRMENSVQTI